MKIYIGFLSLIMITLFSCTKKVVESYDDPNYVYFVNKSEDTTHFSFFFYNQDPVVSFPIDVKYAGKLLTKDARFKVVIDGETTTIDHDLVEIPEYFILKPSTEMDEDRQLLPQKVNIKFKNADYLLTNQDTLTIKIVDGGDCFSVGTEEYGSAVFIITGKAAKPIWWVQDITDYYLGEYSDKKYKSFMTATGIYDLTDMPLGIIRDYCIIFKRYLESEKAAGRTIFEDPVGSNDAVEMVIPVNG